MTLQAAIVPAFRGNMAWAEQAKLYPATGDPGIRLHLDDLLRDYSVLLAYDDQRRLSGVLVYCHRSCLRGRQGELIVWVHPRRRRRGHATRLVSEAASRWYVDPARQRLTPLGALLSAARGATIVTG